MILLFILLLSCNGVYNSTNDVIYIARTEPIRPYKQLIYGIGMVEGELDTLAYNRLEQATGYFQIRPIRLNDYNKRTGKHYKMKDLYDYNISEEIFLYYATCIGFDLETIAKNWNGSGPKTITYWKKVKQYL